MRCFALMLLLGGSVAFGQSKPAKPELKLSDLEQELVDATNAERKKAKLKPVEANPLLFATARKHAAAMAKQDKLENEFDGVTLADRVQIEKYRFTHIGSNIAMGQRTAKPVVEGWMKKEAFRETILTPGFTEIGVGVEKNAKGQLYWTQVFGTPLN